MASNGDSDEIIHNRFASFRRALAFTVVVTIGVASLWLLSRNSDRERTVDSSLNERHDEMGVSDSGPHFALDFEDLTRLRLTIAELVRHGYAFQATQHLQRLLAAGHARTSDLILLAKNGRGHLNEVVLESAHAENPHDPGPILGLLLLAHDRRDTADAESLLNGVRPEVIRNDCELKVQELSWTLNSVADAANDPLFRDSLDTLHAVCSDHPSVWLLTADWSRHASRPEVQSHCLTNVLRRDPWSAAAVQALADVSRIAAPAAARRLLELADTLQQIDKLASQISRQPDDTVAIRQLGIALQSIGRQPEADAWARVALHHDPTSQWGRQQLMATPTASSWRHPALDVSTEPVAELKRPWLELAPTDVEHPAPASTPPKFVSQTLSFRYHSGIQPSQQGRKMHQWTGGGIGVLDYDHDSWPDLYLAQGGSLNVGEAIHVSRLSDDLQRNIRGQQLVSVPSNARVAETGYGQGVAVGDLNNDGFDDLYVANIGHNRTLINQGDGTFLPGHSGDADGVWTTSVAIADLNHDGSPDLYDVNYLTDDDVFTRVCDHEGLDRVCGPTGFAAEADRLWIADGTGGFLSAPEAALPTGSEGRGMGVLITDLDGDGHNDIFVANDESANQLFCAEKNSVRWTDTGLSSGVACDHYGRAQGSMGIALGDTDQNGRPDLFVTNYYGETNTLLTQHHARVFTDTTANAKLAAPGYAMLGFGCQFLDVDADGDQDLVVANGHLDDFTHLGQPFEMRPQLFVNDGPGRFTEAVPDDAFFQTPALGRSVAVVDWNRDGLVDFVMAEVDGRTSLISNATPPVFQPVTIQPTGTVAARMAVGTSSVVSSTHVNQYGWLTAGDGYQCSNQKAICITLPVGTSTALSIRWPGSHHLQQIPLQVNKTVDRWTVIEGRSSAWWIPR